MSAAQDFNRKKAAELWFVTMVVRICVVLTVVALGVALFQPLRDRLNGIEVRPVGYYLQLAVVLLGPSIFSLVMAVYWARRVSRRSSIPSE